MHLHLAEPARGLTASKQVAEQAVHQAGKSTAGFRSERHFCVHVHLAVGTEGGARTEWRLQFSQGWDLPET